MTVREAIERVKTRTLIDLDSEVDLSDPVAAADALDDAARQFSRDTLAFYTWQASLTLTADAAEADLLDPAVCSQQVFMPHAVSVNGAWLQEFAPEEFAENFLDYATASSNAHPYAYTVVAPGSIRMYQAPNATAVAATNYVRGFRLHEPISHTNLDAELEGPKEYHEMIVNRMALDVTVSYPTSGEALARRERVEQIYNVAANQMRTTNLARFRKMVRKGGAGQTRRVYSVGEGWV